MKKMIATTGTPHTGIPYTEGCPMNTAFPSVPVTCVLTSKLIRIVSENDFDVRISFDEPDIEEGTQVVGFDRGGIRYAELKVLIQAQTPPWRGRQIPMMDVFRFTEGL